MKNKVIIDILERLLYEVRRDGCFEGTDYITYVEGVIEGLKESRRDEAVKNIKYAIKHEDEHEVIMEYIDKKFDKLIEMVTKDKVDVSQKIQQSLIDVGVI